MAKSHNGRFLRQRAKVIQLLKNYGDIYISRKDTLHVSVKDRKDKVVSPLNPIVLARMEDTTQADAFRILNKALQRLHDEKYWLYSALNTIYLQSDVGERELDYLKQHLDGSPAFASLVDRHNQAIDWLALWLLDEHLEVFWPNRTHHTKQRDKLYGEVEKVYETFREVDKLPKTKAVEAVVAHYNGAISITTVWKIVKTGEDAGRLRKKLPYTVKTPDPASTP